MQNKRLLFMLSLTFSTHFMMHGAEKTSLPAPMQYTRDRLAIAAAIEADQEVTRAFKRRRRRRTLATGSTATFTLAPNTEEAYRLLSNAPEHEELKSDEIAPAAIPAAAAPQSGRTTRLDHPDNIEHYLGACNDEAIRERLAEAQDEIRRMNPKAMIDEEVQTTLKALPKRECTLFVMPTDSSILYN